MWLTDNTVSYNFPNLHQWVSVYWEKSRKKKKPRKKKSQEKRILGQDQSEKLCFFSIPLVKYSQWYDGKCLMTGYLGETPRLLRSPNLYGISTPIMTDFKLQIWHH